MPFVQDTSKQADLFVLADERSDRLSYDSPIVGTARVSLASSAEHGRSNVSLFTACPERVQTHFDLSTDRAIYLWGIATHASCETVAKLLGWIAQVVEKGDLTSLRELNGHFIVIIDDRRRGTISFISDILGLRPWFVGSFDGRLVAGSNVLSLCKAGLSSGKIDYDAVASWLQYNFDCTGGSVVQDYRRIAPGSISTYDTTGRLLNEVPYAQLTFGYQLRPADAMVDELHEIASRSFEQMVKGRDHLNIPLSGGYDSRYLAAMASRCDGLQMHLTTVRAKPWETPLAERVAKAIGQPLRVIDASRHVLDLFDDPFGFDGAGFPSGRNLTCAIARLHPGMSLVSGFLGDRMIRSTLTPAGTDHFGRDEQGLSLNDLLDSAHQLYAMKLNRLDMLNHRVESRIKERARLCLKGLVERGAAAGKTLAHADLFGRHRLYLSNIFYHHLDEAEALLPFNCWGLLNLHATSAIASYRADSHEILFRRHFPEIAGIPHNHHVTEKVDTSTVTRHLKRWSVDVLRGMLTGELSSINQRKTLMRVPSAVFAAMKHQPEIVFLRKLLAFNQQLRSCNLDLDLRKI